MNCWVKAAACCIINFLVLGIARLAPLLFVASMERYNVNRARAAFPYVLCYLLRTLSGPVIGIAGRKYGLRVVTLFGCIVSFIGIGSCYFAEDLIAVTILWGGVYGLGFGFATALLPIVLDHTFKEKHKTTANGIALAGSSLGGVVIPPIIQAVIAEYGLSGSFLIASGLMLHCVPACLLLSASNLKNTAFENQESKGKANGRFDQDINSKKCCDPHNTFNREIASTNPSNATKLSHSNSTLNKNSSLSGHDNAIFKISDENLSSEKKHEINIPTMKLTTNDCSRTHNTGSDKSISNIYFKSVPKSMEPSGTPKLLQVTIISEYDNTNGKFSEPKICKQDETQTSVKKEDEIQESLFRSFRMFLDPTFLLIMVIQSACAFNLVVVWTIIVDAGRDKGIDRSTEIYSAMVLPLADMIGRVSLGWVTDGGYMSKTQFSVVMFLLLSLITVLFVFAYGLALMILVAILFGFVSGGLMVVFPGVVCEFMNTRYTFMAMSSRMILLAPLSLTTSPLIRFFREERGSYDGLFYVLVCIFILCCGMSALIPRFAQRSKSKHVAEKHESLKINK